MSLFRPLCHVALLLTILSFTLYYDHGASKVLYPHRIQDFIPPEAQSAAERLLTSLKNKTTTFNAWQLSRHHSLWPKSTHDLYFNINQAQEPQVAQVIIDDGRFLDRRYATDLIVSSLQGKELKAVFLFSPPDNQEHKEHIRDHSAYHGLDIFSLPAIHNTPFELTLSIIDYVAAGDMANRVFDQKFMSLASSVRHVDVWRGAAFIVRKGAAEAPSLWTDLAKAAKPPPDKIYPHDYGPAYDMYLEPLRASKGRDGVIQMLEIGLGCGMWYGVGAASKVWRNFFNNGSQLELTVLDFDSNCIFEWAALSENKDMHTHVFSGDQRDPTFLRRIAKERGPFDLIIDDGGHSQDMQIKTLLTLFPDAVAPGGLLVIEDLFGTHSEAYNYDAPPWALGVIFEIASALFYGFDAGTYSSVIKGLEHMDCFAELCVFKRKTDFVT